MLGGGREKKGGEEISCGIYSRGKGELIKVPPHAKVPVCTDMVLTNKKKTTYLRVHIVRVDRTGNPRVQWAGPWNISAQRFLPALGFMDSRLNGWCRCRALTTAPLCRCNILRGCKHQPGCQREQLSLFKAVSF